MNTDMGVPETQWPSIVSAIQLVINNSPSRRLGGRAPIMVHTGMENGNPLSVALTIANHLAVRSLNEAKMIQRLNIESLLESLDAMHKSIVVQLDTARTSAVERHNRKAHIIPNKPCMRDYVVASRMHGPRTKLYAN